MRGAHLNPPAVAEREAVYRQAFESVNMATPAEWRQEIVALYWEPHRDGPGVRALVLLLVMLELLNAECRRRHAHNTTRQAVEAWRRGEGNPDATLDTLTRTWRVFGKRLEEWYAPPVAPPHRGDTTSARAAAWAEHDGNCLDELRKVVAAYDAVVDDVTAGDVSIPPLSDGPFAPLYPVRRPWWKPSATRLCAENILASLRELYAKTDDGIEAYPLKALDRLRAHHETHRTGHLPLDEAVALGARIRTGVRKGARTTPTPAPDAPPPEAPPDYAERLEAFVSKTWGRSMWEALKLRIMDTRTSWEAVARAAGISKAEMLFRRRMLREWRASEHLR